MPRLSANLSMMYQEVDFIDRFGLAAGDGFETVEFLFPYNYPAQEIADQLENHSLKLHLFNSQPGNWQAGERGLTILPDRQQEFEDGLGVAIEYAQALKCPNLHVMAGIVPSDLNRSKAHDMYLRRIEQAAIACKPFKINVLIEPINTRSMPGYFLNYQAQAIDVIKQLLQPNLKLMMDLFHVQMMEGDLENKLIHNLPFIGHIQIAGAPARHEPNTGEINYAHLLPLIDKIGYDGIVGCEYIPANGTSEGLSWITAFN